MRALDESERAERRARVAAAAAEKAKSTTHDQPGGAGPTEGSERESPLPPTTEATDETEEERRAPPSHRPLLTTLRKVRDDLTDGVAEYRKTERREAERTAEASGTSAREKRRANSLQRKAKKRQQKKQEEAEEREERVRALEKFRENHDRSGKSEREAGVCVAARESAQRGGRLRSRGARGPDRVHGAVGGDDPAPAAKERPGAPRPD